MQIVSILAAVTGLAIAAVFMMSLDRSKSGGKGGFRSKGIKDRDALVKAAAKRLRADPRDPKALITMGDIYFQDGAYADALRAYEVLVELAPAAGTVDEFEANVRYGLSALKLNLVKEAYNGLSAARALRQDNFEVNYNLGYLEYQKKNYAKAVPLLDQARRQDPESAPALCYLGRSLFREKHTKEAMAFIREAIDLAPDNKEAVYTLAECYFATNHIDKAMRIFGHLRADPVVGPGACLFSGSINMQQRNTDLAIQDFELGLKHQNIKPEVLEDLRYQLATAYIQKFEIGKAVSLLNLIQNEAPAYKDVPVLIGKYREFNANHNLYIYLAAPSADFAALCRRIVMNHYPDTKIRITNIEVNKNEWADILAEVEGRQWADIIMFRFMRTQGTIGEITIRQFHSRLKEVNAGKGICITMGVFSDEAKHYTEARLIDLIEKDQLCAILKNLDSHGPGAAAPKKQKCF